MTTNEIIKHLLEDSSCVTTKDGDHYRAAIAKLRAADELAECILTSESMNPELALAEAYERAGKGE